MGPVGREREKSPPAARRAKAQLPQKKTRRLELPPRHVPGAGGDRRSLSKTRVIPSCLCHALPYLGIKGLEPSSWSKVVTRSPAYEINYRGSSLITSMSYCKQLKVRGRVVCENLVILVVFKVEDRVPRRTICFQRWGGVT